MSSAKGVHELVRRGPDRLVPSLAVLERQLEELAHPPLDPQRLQLYGAGAKYERSVRRQLQAQV